MRPENVFNETSAVVKIAHAVTDTIARSPVGTIHDTRAIIIIIITAGNVRYRNDAPPSDHTNPSASAYVPKANRALIAA